MIDSIMQSDCGYHSVGQALRQRLAETAPGRVQVVTGPRQVGKTHLLLSIADELGDGAVYLAADAPEASIPGWWELNFRNAVRRAQAHPTVLLIDEVQYLPRWERLVKSAYDELQRTGARLHLVLTGSAALGIGAGVAETMAGRFERLELRHWSARDMARAFGLTQVEACEMYVRFGSFPGAVPLLADAPRWRAYVRDAIIAPALGRDLLLLQQVRRPALLRQVFAVAAGYPAQIVSLNKLAGVLQDSGAPETIASYLELLERAYLMEGIRKWSAREMRRRASPPKLVPLSNAMLAAARTSAPPTRAEAPAEWGAWLENACLAFAVNSGQRVHYWREEPHEVDGIIEGDWGEWAIEVKSGPFTSSDLRGLLEFVRRNPEFRAAVICDRDAVGRAPVTGICTLDWRDYLWEGLTGA